MYKCYDGQLLLPLDFEQPIYERDTSTKTEQTYVDRERQIASFIRSGERLQNARKEEFEYPDGEVPSDVKVDPTTVIGFDLADASQLVSDLKSKAAAANKAEAAAAKSEGVAGETDKSVPPISQDHEKVDE